MRFDSAKIQGLLQNEGNCIGKTMQGIRFSRKDGAPRIAVAQGFGVQDGGIPLRFLAYTVPVLHLMRQLPENAVAEFYVALHGCLRANHLNEQTARENGNRMTALVEMYTALIHPDVAPRVRVLLDEPVEPDSEMDRYLASLFTDEVRSDCMADEPIHRFVEKRGGKLALRYMVEHAVYMRDPLATNVEPIRVLVSGMRTNIDTVIMVGGPAEKIFYRVRQILQRRIGSHNRWASHQLFTKIGDPPTYHPQEHELLWDERSELAPDAPALFRETANRVKAEGGIRESVVHDLLILLGDAGGATNFAEIVQERKRVFRREEFSPPIQAVLQRGWERIQNISHERLGS